MSVVRQLPHPARPSSRAWHRSVSRLTAAGSLLIFTIIGPLDAQSRERAAPAKTGKPTIAVSAAKDRETPTGRLYRDLDQFYTWGDVVERWRCRVHGRWMKYGPGLPRGGEFWGDLRYEKGRFRLTVTRTRDVTRAAVHWENAITELVRQAGLLPTGFPVPKGRVVERERPAGHARYAVEQDGKDSVVFDFRGGRLTGLALAPGQRFDVGSRSVPGDRRLVTRFVMRHDAGPGARTKVTYAYQTFVGNYFPRAIAEERNGASLTLLFFQHEVHIKP